MEDSKIVELFWQRSETAVAETEAKYGRYCYKIAYNILNSNEDAEECVNDTYVNAWNAIPPRRPAVLSAFLGRITRNLALDRYMYNKAQKRSADMQVVLEELGECVPGSMGSHAEEIAMKDAVNSFLSGLPSKTRIIFMRRYWYLSSVKEIAEDMNMTESNIKVLLMRTRNKFRTHLENRGIMI